MNRFGVKKLENDDFYVVVDLLKEDEKGRNLVVEDGRYSFEEAIHAANRREQMWEKAKNVARTLANVVNRNEAPKEYIAEAILDEHRTLQQQIFELFLTAIKAWSELEEGWYDLRNEYTVESSKKIMKLMESEKVPFI